MVLAGGIVIGGCTPAPATSQADEVAWLYGLFMATGAVVFVLVAGLIGWCLVRYRAKGSDELPPQTRGGRILELTWWSLPTFVVVALGIVTAVVLGSIDSVAAGGGPGSKPLSVEVEGFRWGWRFSYPASGVVVADGPSDEPVEIVLPINRPIIFELTSLDVIHSFYVPSFLTKRDLVPGHPNRIELTINELGRYSGQCAEFCGLLHSRMRFTIRAVDPDDFAAWLAATPGETGTGASP